MLTIYAATHMLSLAMASQGLGIFDGQQVIGGTPGQATYEKNIYSVSGKGNFVWKKVTGDQSISAEIAQSGKLLIRQNLTPDSPFAEVVVSGNGSVSIQYREALDQETKRVEFRSSSPKKLQIERRGKYISAYISNAPAGSSVRVDIQEPYYIGLSTDSAKPVAFSKVEISEPESTFIELYSTLETIDIESKTRHVVQVKKDHFEAPNWTPDGKDLIYNGGGLLYRIAVSGGEPAKIDTGFATRCNNDHGLSSDGKWIAISDHSKHNNLSTIYVLPSTGGTPRKITEGTPSYWHGWSPDGKTLAYCAQREGKYGIFTIPASGGMETRLTTTDKLDDGPDYSPDGKHIYFNSDRTGKMQIYRMSATGEAIERMTEDENNNWFPHISPNGKWMVFLTYEPDVEGHPANKDVMLRLMNLSNRKITVLTKLFGGQGTINVPSWSPDSKQLAYVSYQFLP